MKVLHVIESAGLGGAQTCMELLLHGLREKGYDVEAGLPFDGPLVGRLQDAGIPCHEMPMPRRVDPRPGRVVSELVRRGLDIIHVHTPKAGMLVRPAAAAARGSDPLPRIVMQLHGIGTPSMLREKLPPVTWAKKRVLWELEKRGDACTDHFVLLTQADLEKGFYPPEKCTVIPNGIDPALWPSAPMPDSNTILSPARLSTQKDPFTLLEAARLLKQQGVSFRLLLAGDGELREEVELRIRNLNLSEEVEVLGDVQDMYPLYESAGVVVLSTHREGQPLVFLEAMCVGRPVVATDVDGNAETLGDAGIVVPHEDASALAGALRTLLEDGALAAQMAAAGRARVRSRFTLDAMISRVADLYRRIL